MKQAARSSLTYGAATLASGIAVISAIEAWLRLQDSAGMASLVSHLASDTLLVIALPLLAVAAAVGLRWSIRSLAGGRAAAGATPDSTAGGPKSHSGGTASTRTSAHAADQSGLDR